MNIISFITYKVQNICITLHCWLSLTPFLFMGQYYFYDESARTQQYIIYHPITINILFERIFFGSNNNTIHLCRIYFLWWSKAFWKRTFSYNDRHYYLLDDAVNIFLITSCLPYNNKQTWTRHICSHIKPIK